MSSADETLLDAARQALVNEDLPDGSWSLGQLVDDRPCLLLEDHTWIAGFFERGEFVVRFEAGTVDEAIVRFAEWVRSIDESTRLSAEATERWLRRMGKARP